LLLIDELLVVSDDSLGESLSDGVDLGDLTSSVGSDLDVKVGKLVLAEDEEGLLNLVAEEIRVDGVESESVDAETTLTRSDDGNSDSGFFASEGLDVVLLLLRHIALRMNGFGSKLIR